jgi:hypothetical protein
MDMGKICVLKLVLIPGFLGLKIQNSLKAGTYTKKWNDEK